MKSIQLDQSGDISVQNGDFVLGEINEDIVQSLLIASKGEFKEDLNLGANVQAFLNGMVDPFWTQETKRMLKIGGVDVKNINITDNEIIID